ncbi:MULTISPECIES: hypothetical protein [Bacillus]|uniref:hypothetical protein n=1 Tax=Bacillus TaxID=1386 RepID=UPI0005350E59|nr:MULTISPECIES: hypothetical protein [Bacillus cereus group]OTY48727.1 hypothetical protein BK748_30840 [Bacillus thuringiensis serovar graciosensis]PFD94047.1 hypothetical protein CN275_00755 [Bacillus anthracis]PFT22448.1 hypothetical protein COK52_16965 [Bacillus thuringiensis]AXY10138.1 hypothetical protein CUC43_26790 [Bacillus thuringiensis LM1212]MED2900859.1 hypothetical protein [Bacillus tropicus]
MNHLFRFLIRLNRKKSLVTTMTEKEVEDVNRCIRIVLINMMMSVMWFMIQEVMQVTLCYQIHDLLIGAICFTIVYLLYDKLGLR